MGRYLNKERKAVALKPVSLAALEAARTSGAGAIGPALFAHVLPADDAEAREALESEAVKAGDSTGGHPRFALLVQAGYAATRPDGSNVFDEKGRATWTGPVTWSPVVPLPRVDDQEKLPARRLVGEVAVAAALRAEMANRKLPWSLVRHVPAGQTRGADFKNTFATYIAGRLKDDWEITSELPLNNIYGLHMRRDVGERSSDIVAIGPPDRRLFAIISSKASWRTDRGTEAAAMVPLRRYRPDVPYVMVTAEFPRAAQILRESPEDRVYHVVPRLWAAWSASLVAYDQGEEITSLEQLLTDADQILAGVDLPDLDALVDDLKGASTVL